MLISTPPTSHTEEKALKQSASALTKARTSNKFVQFANALKATALGVLCVIAAGTLIECFLALNHIGEQEYLKVDPLIGFAHLENKIVTDRSEFLGIDRINSHGLSDVEHSISKAPDTERIAILGDSITEAMQVPIKQRFARVLENKLNTDSKQKFDVVNFGIGGFGTGHEYLQFIRDVQIYKPDQLILMYHQGDETENAPDGSKWSLQPSFTLNSQNNPEVRYQEFDNWRKSASAAPLTAFDWARRNSHIWQSLLQMHSTMKNEPLYKRITDLCTKIDKALNKTSAATQLTSDARVKTERQNLLTACDMQEDTRQSPWIADASQQWLLTKKLIGLLSEKCRSENIRLTIAFVPALEKPVSSRVDFSEKISELTKMSKQDGFQTLDLTKDFYSAQQDVTRPIILVAHLSPRGHEMVAEALRRHLLKQ